MAMILVGGLLIRSFIELAAEDLGYSRRGGDLSGGRASGEGAAARAFADKLVERIGALCDSHRGRLCEQPAACSNRVSAATSAPRPLQSREAAGAVSRPACRQPANDSGARSVPKAVPLSDGEAGRGEALITRAFARSGSFDGASNYSSRTSWEVVGILDDVSIYWLGQRAGSEL